MSIKVYYPRFKNTEIRLRPTKIRCKIKAIRIKQPSKNNLIRTKIILSN